MNNSTYSSPFKRGNRRGNDVSVNWYQHFPKDYIRPYGRSILPEDVTDETITRRLQTFSCEWLTRPSVAMSEFSETILRNHDKSADIADLMDPRGFPAFQHHLAEVMGEVAPLWVHPANPKSEETLSSAEIATRMNNLEKLVDYDRNPFLKAYLEVMLDVGNSLYVTAMHLKMISFLTRNKELWALRMRADPDHEEFKQKHGLNEYASIIHKDYMVKKGYNVTPIETPTRRRIADLLNVSGPSRSSTITTIRAEVERQPRSGSSGVRRWLNSAEGQPGPSGVTRKRKSDATKKAKKSKKNNN